jgi:putative phosphoesterase
LKIGIFSDIHGNIYAFEKIWAALKKESCELYLFLGDICGYYYHQNEIIEMLKGINNLIAIRGNHDDLFLRILRDNKTEAEYTRHYGKSATILKGKINQDILKFLRKLPKKIVLPNKKIGIFHGSPWRYLDEYIYPTANLGRFGKLPYSYIFLGHTHYPMYKTVKGIKIINPGSCGQPRDSGKPSYATVDLDSGKVSLKRVSYNNSALIKDILRHSEKNKYLIEVLMRN